MNTTPSSFSEQGGPKVSPGRNQQLNPKMFGLLFLSSTTKRRAYKQEQLDAPCSLSVCGLAKTCSCKKIPEKCLRGTYWSVRHLKCLFFSFPSFCERKAKQQNVRDSKRTVEDTIFPRVSPFALPSSKVRDTLKYEAPGGVRVL